MVELESGNNVVTLTDLEKSLFTELNSLVCENELQTTMRVAGGWVRDKMLGLESDDIDISLSDVSGRDLAKLLEEKGLVKIQSSTSQGAAHLQTAAVIYDCQSIDLVNLRKETYDETSRVPQVELGTPEEDAYRRDLTVNALFYNVGSGEIEDFTGYGLTDLKNKVIRTCTEPIQSFLDDPLRVIRTIRFSNRFEFNYLPEVVEALKNEAVKAALDVKVSPELFRKELDKVLGGRNPHKAIQQLHEFGLLPWLFSVPKTCQELQNAALVKQCVDMGAELCQQLDFTGCDPKDDDFRMQCFYGALLLPFFPYKSQGKKEKDVETVLMHFFQTSLKLTKSQQKFVLQTIEHFPTC